MSTFVDTSALLAVLDGDDRNHAAAKTAWDGLLAGDEAMYCTSYVLVEAFALAQHRLGLPAVRSLQEDVVPVLRIVWVDVESHNRSVAALLTAGRRQLSLVDCVSFEVMRRVGLTAAFAFDRHFAEQGFQCVP